MGDLGRKFDAANHEPEENQFDPIPAKWYRALCTSAELKPNNAGTGSYIKCRWDIVGPDYIGRVVFSNITWEHDNPEDPEKSKKAVAIGEAQLKLICDAIGVAGLEDTGQLVCDVPVEIKLKIAPATAQYEAQNEVVRYREVTDATLADSGEGYKKPPAKGEKKESGGGEKKGGKPWKKSA